MKTFNQIMLDLETFGSRSDAMIVSVGAVKFNLDEIDTYDSIVSDPSRTFSMHLDTAAQERIGMTLDAETVKWWMQQNDLARKFIYQADTSDLGDFFQEFNNFCFGVVGLWGNGATFDNVILRNLYKKASLKFPLPFWADRCYRTVKALVPSEKNPEFIRYGVHHSAVDDAISQVIHLQKMLERPTPVDMF